MRLVSSLDSAARRTLFLRLAGTPERLAHLSRHAYCGQPIAQIQVEVIISASRGIWFIVTDEDGPIGLINHGSAFPGHANAFGMVIARDHARRGHGRAALAEFVDRHEEFGVRELNGFCHRDNAAILRIMRAVGFVQDATFVDLRDPDTLKFTHPLGP
jgi:RimJ/RimL family protein N-acetyltransferase